jgi:ribonuclease BN (tRNA processing enzyme)
VTPPFQLICLGVGDAFSEVYYHTSFLLLAGESRLQIDCPEPIRKILRESTAAAGVPTRLEDVDDFLITHLHADHCSAFETVCHYKRHRQGVLPHLHVSPEVMDVIWDQRLRAAMGHTRDMRTGQWRDNALSDFCVPHTLAHGAENQIGPFRIEIRQTQHIIPTVGVIARVGDASVGYACDTIFDLDHIAWLSSCDMIIHEWNTGPHTSLEDLMSLPEEIRAKLRLVHYPDDFDTASSPIPCLRQGGLYTIAKSQ